ncbi:MAG: hypothetical protein IJA55_04405 [Clostridia bacterium]|nr:hypothetical protein [Clostridia bacterium]
MDFKDISFVNNSMISSEDRKIIYILYEKWCTFSDMVLDYKFDYEEFKTVMIETYRIYCKYYRSNAVPVALFDLDQSMSSFAEKSYAGLKLECESAQYLVYEFLKFDNLVWFDDICHNIDGIKYNTSESYIVKTERGKVVIDAKTFDLGELIKALDYILG